MTGVTRRLVVAWGLVGTLGVLLALSLSRDRSVTLPHSLVVAPGEVLVHVVDELGRSAEGVLVSMLDVSPQRATTDAAGAARFKVQSGNDVVIKAWRGEQFAAVGPLYIPRQQGEQVHLKLAEGVVAIGKVTNGAGDPMQDFELVFAWAGADMFDTRLAARVALADTEGNGSFRAGPIEHPGMDSNVQLELRVWAKGHRPYILTVPPWRGSSTCLEIKLPR